MHHLDFSSVPLASPSLHLTRPPEPPPQVTLQAAIRVLDHLQAASQSAAAQLLIFAEAEAARLNAQGDADHGRHLLESVRSTIRVLTSVHWDGFRSMVRELAGAPATSPAVTETPFTPPAHPPGSLPPAP